MRLIQIVPALPPKVNGLGDHAFLLAKELRTAHGIQTMFLVGTPSIEGVQELEDFQIFGIRERRIQDFVDALTAMTGGSAATVLLHYVGYGYARRGSPVWLVEGLEKWRPHSNGNRLITMFHELYASGPFWRSSFWTAALQKSLARRLATLSDCCRTSTKTYARRLDHLSPPHHGSISVSPVFSNAGEGVLPRLPKDRTRRLVVFGNEVSRRSVYEGYAVEVARACDQLAVNEIIDIGPSTKAILDFPVRITATGVLNSDQLSSILDTSLAGMVNYPSAFLGKSTIFAAYAAHAVVPVLVGAGSEPCEDGLQSGEHYLDCSLPRGWETGTLDKISERAFDWYAGHSLRKQTVALADLLKMTCAKVDHEQP